MSVVVNTNSLSIGIQSNLQNATTDLAKRMKRLSSGLRINSASDDAAGLAISAKLNSHISGSDVAKNNTQTGINMLQTAEADLGQIATHLQRMRDLAVQSANGVYSDSERDALDAEYLNLISEIGRITDSSSFAGINFFETSAKTIKFQVGTGNTESKDTVSVTFKTNTDIKGNLGHISTVTLATTAIGELDVQISTISLARATLGSSINRLSGTITRIATTKENLASAKSTLMDADIAEEAAAMTRSQILQQTATTMLQQANQAPSIALMLVQ